MRAPATTNATGTARWITRPGKDGFGVLEISAETKAGLRTETYAIEPSAHGYTLTKDGDVVYSLDMRDPEHLMCNCPDFQGRRIGTGTHCKHIGGVLAALAKLN